PSSCAMRSLWVRSASLDPYSRVSCRVRWMFSSSFISCWSSRRLGSTPVIVCPARRVRVCGPGTRPVLTTSTAPSGIREGAMDLAFLHPLYEHPGRWASVYVGTSRHTEDTPHERHLTARAMASELAGQGADEATCRVVGRAIDELRHSSEPHGRALFARGGEVVLDPPLARAPQRDHAVWAPLPRVTPLLELAGEDPVCVVAYVDRKGAAFELRSALGRDDAGGVTGRQWPVHRTGSVDWSERRFQLRVENTWEHNAAEIADALAVSQEETGADLLILVGDDRERHEVRRRLPQRLHHRVVEAA